MWMLAHRSSVDDALPCINVVEGVGTCYAQVSSSNKWRTDSGISDAEWMIGMRASADNTRQGSQIPFRPWSRNQWMSGGGQGGATDILDKKRHEGRSGSELGMVELPWPQGNAVRGLDVAIRKDGTVTNR
jgi:hypothetical protein